MRKKSLRTFDRKTDSLHVIVATSAFGLGVNLKSICVGLLLSVNNSASSTFTLFAPFKPTFRRSDVTAGQRQELFASPYSRRPTLFSSTPPVLPPT